MKKIFWIISLILSILGLVLLIDTRYELSRYHYLHRDPIEYYTKLYPTLAKADKNRVIVAFSASSEEIKNMKPFVSSILDQAVKVDDIVLITPYKNVGTIPLEYKTVLSINGYSRDYDDADSLICSVLREPDQKTKIILVSPTMVYGRYFINSMVDAANQNPDKVIYGTSDKDIAHGVLIRPAFFTNDVSNYQKGIGCCPWLKKCCSAQDFTIDFSPIYKSRK